MFNYLFCYESSHKILTIILGNTPEFMLGPHPGNQPHNPEEVPLFLLVHVDNLVLPNALEPPFAGQRG